MRGERHLKGTLRAPVMMAVIAVLISLLPLLVSCSSEESRGQPDRSRQSGEDKRADATRGGQSDSGRTEVEDRS